MSDKTEVKAPSLADLAAEPLPPTLTDLARALDDAKAAHAAANAKSNESAFKAADDQAAESVALQAVAAARDALLAAAKV
jgi:hypothetical protein